MAQSQAAERTFTPFAEARPDLLPDGWRGKSAQPLEIDVGCHKGRFLLEMAQQYPLSNFLGVERQKKRVEKTQKKISQLGLPNAAVVHSDGLEAISLLPDACADHIHVLFPDPWPKRRHKIRRMVQSRFLCEVLRILKQSGILRLVTDDPDYWRAMEFHGAGLFGFRRIAEDGREYPLTEFEIKFLADSRPIYRLLFERFS